jgi:GAF domain-containing protein
MNESVHRGRTASELQDRVDRLIEQQTAISWVLRAIASSPHDLQPIFDAILDSATRLCRADLGTLRLSEDSGLRRVAARGDPLLVSQVWSSFPVLVEKGSLPRRLATSRLPTHIPDLTALEGDHRDDFWIPTVNAGYRTSLVVPLLKDDEIVGIVIWAANSSSRSPTNRFPYSGLRFASHHCLGEHPSRAAMSPDAERAGACQPRRHHGPAHRLDCS